MLYHPKGKVIAALYGKIFQLGHGLPKAAVISLCDPGHLTCFIIHVAEKDFCDMAELVRILRNAVNDGLAALVKLFPPAADNQLLQLGQFRIVQNVLHQSLGVFSLFIVFIVITVGFTFSHLPIGCGCFFKPQHSPFSSSGTVPKQRFPCSLFLTNILYILHHIFILAQMFPCVNPNFPPEH